MSEEKTQHQLMAIEALENLQSICDRHNLRLYLLAGTALGAVRHKGMIPWDDDIDVGLTFDDWYKIRSILPEELDPKFQYIDYLTNPGFPRMFGKILYDRQNCVDVFLIAKWTESRLKGNLHWQIRRLATEFYKYSLDYESPRKPNITDKQRRHEKRMIALRKSIFRIVDLFHNTEDYIRLAQWNEKYFERHKYDCYVNIYSIYKMEKERIKKEWIESPSYVSFEGKRYLTVGDPDAYLTHLYGDYMTPPPPEMRVGSHEELFD